MGALLFVMALSGQQQTGTVSGKVVNSVTGEAIKKAVVSLRSANGQNSVTTVSDQSGKFHIDNVPPDKYRATAVAMGYSQNMVGTGKPVVVAAQQEVEDVEVRIPPLTAISGKVVDEDGQPLAQVQVMALQYADTGFGKRMQVGNSVQTDDRGQYRMFDLQPDRYYLLAMSYQRQGQPRSPQNQNIHSTVPEEGYAPVFFPGAADLSQAQLQDVKPGVEWTGADFKLHRMAAYHIRGTVTGATGARGGRTMVRAQWCGQDETEVPFSLGAAAQTDSGFDIAWAVPGTYCLTVTQPVGGGVAAKKTVTVKASDLDGIEFVVPPAFSVNGTVAIDGTPPSPMPSINIGLSNEQMRTNRQVVAKSDGTFQVEGLYPGAYSLFMPQQGPLYVKSVFYGSQDVTNGLIPNLQPGVALNVTLGTDPGQIGGTVQPGGVESGAPVLVAAIPVEAYAARQDMRRIVPTSAGGNFAFPGMAPGTYEVFALETIDFNDAQDRDLLKLLESGATAVTVTANGNQQVNVTAIAASQVEQAKGKLK